MRDGLATSCAEPGYETAYGGKQHLPKSSAEELGFDYICEDERDELARACGRYVEQAHSRPFCLVASFINPHDICHLAINEFATKGSTCF